MGVFAEHDFRVEVRAYSGLLHVLSWLMTTAYTLLLNGPKQNLSPARVRVVRLRDGAEVWHRNCYKAGTVWATKERLDARLRARNTKDFCREQGIRPSRQERSSDSPVVARGWTLRRRVGRRAKR